MNEFCDIKDISQWINGCESIATTSELSYFVIIAISVCSTVTVIIVVVVIIVILRRYLAEQQII